MDTTPNFPLLSQQASQVFVPASPIVSKDLFAGRIRQLTKVMDVVNQVGQHAILFGERGVGKTSLANVLAPLARAVNKDLVSAKVNCDGTDTLDTVWRKAFGELKWLVEKQAAGFTGGTQQILQSLSDRLPAEKATPNDIRQALTLNVQSVFIFDEFDRLPPRAARLFTDLIKALSDYASPVTIVLVGVAGTVGELIEHHASIERALVQIPMPRMEATELTQILKTGASKLGMTFVEQAASQIVHISQGLPHYTHLIGLYTVRAALADRSLSVTEDHVFSGLEESVDNAHQSIKTQYHAATGSSHKSALFEQVLLACALAKKDQLSFFRAADVQHPLSVIMGKKYDVPAFARHLSEFCTSARSSVLEREGPSRRIKYRFVNPLLEPFIIMRGRSRGLITADALSAATAA